MVHFESSYIETNYSGELSAVELREAILQTLTLVHNHGIHRLLGDCSSLLGGHSVADVKDFFDMVKKSDKIIPIREAILIPTTPEAMGYVYFWTCLAQIKGMVVKPFEGRQEALAWLLDPRG